jgi:hypothetical protein
MTKNSTLGRADLCVLVSTGISGRECEMSA